MPLGTAYITSRRASKDEDWNREGERVFRIAYGLDFDEVYVRDTCGFVVNLPHPSDPGMVIVNVGVDQENPEPSKFANPLGEADGDDGEDCYWWMITITYAPWNPLDHTITGDPTDQPAEPSFQWQVFEQPCDVAWDENDNVVAVLNSAGIAFDPAVSKEQLKGVMRIAYNSLTFVPGQFFAYGNMINKYPIWGFAEHTIKISPPNMPQRLWSQFLMQNYYRLELELCFNPNDGGWDEWVIDRGRIALDSGGHPYWITDTKGQPYPDPSLLDGSGHLQTDPTMYQIIKFRKYASVDFYSVLPQVVLNVF